MCPRASARHPAEVAPVQNVHISDHGAHGSLSKIIMIQYKQVGLLK